MSTAPERPDYAWRAAKAVLALAKIELAVASAMRETPNNWPAGQEWDELAGSSRGVFVRRALETAGLDAEAFWEMVRSAELEGWDDNEPLEHDLRTLLEARGDNVSTAPLCQCGHARDAHTAGHPGVCVVLDRGRFGCSCMEWRPEPPNTDASTEGPTCPECGHNEHTPRGCLAIDQSDRMPKLAWIDCECPGSAPEQPSLTLSHKALEEIRERHEQGTLSALVPGSMLLETHRDRAALLSHISTLQHQLDSLRAAVSEDDIGHLRLVAGQCEALRLSGNHATVLRDLASRLDSLRGGA